MYIQDNYDAFNSYEREYQRTERRRLREELEEDLSFRTVPSDYGTHKDCYPSKEE